MLNKTAKIAVAVLLGVATAACGPYQSWDLHGDWQAFLLTEENNVVDIDPSLVRFHFDREGYTFSSTLNYREKGSYYLKGDRLFTADKLAQGAKEKAVLIQRLANDTLVLGMEEGGRKRQLSLRRLPR